MDSEDQLEAARIENLAWRKMGRPGAIEVEMTPKGKPTLPAPMSSPKLCLVSPTGTPTSSPNASPHEPPLNFGSSPTGLRDIVENQPLEEWASATVAAKTGEIDEVRRENMAWRMMHMD